MDNVNKSIFRAYDIRGVYPSEINEGVVAEIAPALLQQFKKGKVIVGHDARLSSPALCESLLKSFTELRSSNLDLLSVGLITTPMLTFLVNNLGASGGVMVTASHNPKEYNGLKIIGEKGKRISGEQVYESIYKSVH